MDDQRAEVRSPLQGTVARVEKGEGAEVAAGGALVVIESMKMEHAVGADIAGVVREVRVTVGDAVRPGDVLAIVALVAEPLPPPAAASAATPTPASGAPEPATPPQAAPAPASPVGAEAGESGRGGGQAPGTGTAPTGPGRSEAARSIGTDPERWDTGSGGGGQTPSAAQPVPGAAGPVEGAAEREERPTETGESSEPAAFGVGQVEAPLRADLAEVWERHAIGHDDRRPEAVERRRKIGKRTARENVADLVDPDSFIEYGPLAIAAQRRRRELDDLITRTPADGLVAGVGRVDGQPVAALSYDYTVLAGTQGYQNHRKKDRLFELIERQQLPTVFFTEGGGGRPGDVDAPGVSGLDTLAFNLWGRLSGLVPMVGIASGRCFAGNAALLGCCDVVIATEGTNIGMGGPAMIEGGGLGTFAPEDIGPLEVQVANGVVDIAVADEAEAVAVARKYLSYFTQRQVPGWSAPDPELARKVVPENRRQAYDVRAAVDALADEGSVLELRSGFGAGMVTALARVEGRSLGIVANNPVHLAGAIDADGGDKAARFLQLCDAFDLPVLFLCDTPGIMVGPEAETTGLVRHVNRLFVTGANLSVPFGTIVLRKGYGLGAQAMAGGTFKAPLFCVAWPTGEIGGMGLEGAVRLGFSKELAAIDDPEARERAFEEMVERAYQHGKALNAATHFELDDVIDPADSRRWIASTFAAAPPPPPRSGKKRPHIDTW